MQHCFITVRDRRKVEKCHTHAHIYTQMAAISRDFAFHTYCRFIDSAPRSHNQIRKPMSRTHLHREKFRKVQQAD